MLSLYRNPSLTSNLFFSTGTREEILPTRENTITTKQHNPISSLSIFTATLFAVVVSALITCPSNPFASRHISGSFIGTRELLEWAGNRTLIKACMEMLFGP